MTRDQRSEIFGWQDDILLAITDGKPMPWEALHSLPPYRASLLARVAARAGLITQLEADAVHEQAVKVGGTNWLPRRRMNPAKLIAMHGDFGSGKDTVAERLVAEHGFTRLAFADQLKKLCEILDPIAGQEHWPDHLRRLYPMPVLTRLKDVVAEIGWDDAKKRYPEVRRTQQVLATDVIREHVDPHYWVDFVADQIKDGGKYVITDLRFPNEWELVDALGGQVWWIERPDHDYGAEAQAKSHVSEAWHPPRFCKVINDYDVAELWAKVDVAVHGGGFACLEQLA